MPEYLLELYVPADGASAAGTGAGSVRRAAELVTMRGGVARYLRSIYVAADETCFVLLEAETIQTALEVARLAAVPSNRVSEVAGELSDADRQPVAGSLAEGTQ
ncbi:MAG TPA: hypothetical protein VME70_07735 [Mycobacteriales bacterium]|nr:hypothetical protein [Mycobacteriales bacterium]